MPDRFESLIRTLGLQYRKEVNRQGRETYSFPFDTAQGPLVVSLLDTDAAFCAYTFLRSVDSIGVTTSHKEFYLALLKLNGASVCARTFVWTDENDVDWIGVAADVPEPSPAPPLAKLLIEQVARLAEEVLAAIAERTSIAREVPPGIASIGG